MLNCQNCGTDIEADAQFCGECGQGVNHDPTPRPTPKTTKPKINKNSQKTPAQTIPVRNIRANNKSRNQTWVVLYLNVLAPLLSAELTWYFSFEYFPYIEQDFRLLTDVLFIVSLVMLYTVIIRKFLMPKKLRISSKLKSLLGAGMLCAIIHVLVTSSLGQIWGEYYYPLGAVAGYTLFLLSTVAVIAIIGSIVILIVDPPKLNYKSLK